MNNRVLLGMSGGTDSSVSAILLQEQGFEVVGITFIFSERNELNTNAVNDAQTLAKRLNLKHIVADLRKEFNESVIQYFIDEYKSGKTPFPCAYCNPKMKFFYLQKYADIENCDFIATGHYAQIFEERGQKYIFEGVDVDKDQSFFLWGLDRQLLSRLIFPLGGFTKKRVRELAYERGFLSISKKKDSLGICFIEGKDYREFLKKEGIISSSGEFISTDGQVLGRHSGIENYTIGQRHGLGIKSNSRLFVAEIRVDDNKIVLAEYAKLYRSKLLLNKIQLVDIEDVNPNAEYVVKVRYRLQLSPCKIDILPEGRAEVELLKPEAMIANGQTAVFYDGGRLIGGGFIEASE